MSTNYVDLAKLYREKMAGQSITPLSDEAVEEVSGGLGGADEATCPYCRGNITMTKVSSPYGDDYWTCPNCGGMQILSDAETIEMIHCLEAMGYTEFDYPVWWSQIQKNLR